MQSVSFFLFKFHFLYLKSTFDGIYIYINAKLRKIFVYFETNAN